MIKDIVKGDECSERLAVRDSIILEYSKMDIAYSKKDSTCQHSISELKTQVGKQEAQISQMKDMAKVKNIGLLSLFVLTVLIAVL